MRNAGFEGTAHVVIGAHPADLRAQPCIRICRHAYMHAHSALLGHHPVIENNVLFSIFISGTSPCLPAAHLEEAAINGHLTLRRFALSRALQDAFGQHHTCSGHSTCSQTSCMHIQSSWSC